MKLSLCMIVKNEADVPVAIKRVVNPKFPLEFSMGEAEDKRYYMECRLIDGRSE